MNKKINDVFDAEKEYIINGFSQDPGRSFRRFRILLPLYIYIKRVVKLPNI